METTVVLCSVPELDINHNHTYTFNTKQAQLDFFNSRKTLVFNEVMYQKDNDSIKLDIVYGNSKLMSSNYLYFRNPDDNVIHYCFIVNKKYINENTTQLFLKLDVMQTYLVGIDYHLSDSFIERQHMNEMKSNGKPDLDVLNRPEDIEVGEYVVGNTINIYDFEQSGGYIVASTDKLSKKKASTGGGIPGGSSGGSSGGGTTPTPSVTGDKIVASARKLIGKPYILGGNYPPLGSDAGTDCSGLCRWAYNDNGITIPRVTYDQVQQGTPVNKDSLQPGDLIFMIFSEAGPEHVVMFANYNGDGSFQVIEAREPGTNIGEFTRTWGSDYMARRIISNSGGSSGSSSAAPQPSNPEWDSIPSNVQTFINAVYEGANAGYHQYNLFASLTIAQGGLETGWNTSPAGNNLFGIKADSSWTGKTFTSETWEDYGDGPVQVTATFRAYDSISDSVLDRCKFLKENQRYTDAGVFTASTPEAQAQALKDAGYATDPAYVSKLTGIINNYNLKVYDI